MSTEEKHKHLTIDQAKTTQSFMAKALDGLDAPHMAASIITEYLEDEGYNPQCVEGYYRTDEDLYRYHHWCEVDGIIIDAYMTNIENFSRYTLEVPSGCNTEPIKVSSYYNSTSTTKVRDAFMVFMNDHKLFGKYASSFGKITMPTKNYHTDIFKLPYPDIKDYDLIKNRHIRNKSVDLWEIKYKLKLIREAKAEAKAKMVSAITIYKEVAEEEVSLLKQMKNP